MPERVGKYAIIGILGSGAFGNVYLAEDPDLGRQVAVKQLAPQLWREPGFMDGFREEAAIMARLDHPNCVQVYDYFEDKTGAYIVSEYVRGASLRKLLIDNGRLGPEQALGVTRGALTGLAFAHQLDLVHRDVKPENLLADMTGASKLADFGQAFFTSEAHTGDRQSTGSPAYMSPEQVRGDQGDVRSDVYAAGVVLYEFLAGRPPFIALSRLAVMKMHVEREPPELNRVNPRIPIEVSRVVGTALAKDPADRYSSAAEFLAVLEQVARETYGAGWLEAASISGLVAAAAPAAALPGASPEGAPAAGPTTIGEAEVTAPPTEPEAEAPAAVPEAPAPEPPPAADPPTPEPPPPAPEPVPVPASAPSAAVVAALASADKPADGGRPRRSPGVGAGIVAAVVGLLLGAALGVVSPLGGRSAGVTPAASPTASGAAGPTVSGISARFDDATGTTYYQLQGADATASFRWGWLRKPPCGTLQSDPSGLAAGYAHNGCNAVAEAAGVLAVCVTTPNGSALFQRNARFGDGALTPDDAAAAGVSDDQFSRQQGPVQCGTVFTDAAAAAVAPVPIPGAATPPAPSASASSTSQTAEASAAPTPTPVAASATDVIPPAAAALGGLLLAAAGMLMLRRRAVAA